MPKSVLANQSLDFPQWYQDVLSKAELAENGMVRGAMVIRPYGYAIWERMQTEIDGLVKETGAENAYLVLLIPESYLHRETEHVEGFSPEIAVVTHTDGKQLDEPVAVRTTSEILFGEVMARWVQMNQWANVVRWCFESARLGGCAANVRNGSG